MGPPDDASDSGSPAGSEPNFDRLLISENFSPANYRDDTLTTCVSWLRSREREVSEVWTLEFRLNRPELHKALTEVRGKLLILLNKMDRLCGGSRSYLAVNLGQIPTKTQKMYDEFLVTNDELGDVLDEYLAYANYYKTKYEKGEIPDTKPPRARPPTAIRQDFFGKLKLLAAALKNLAASLEFESAETADVGVDAPDRPERRPA